MGVRDRRGYALRPRDIDRLALGDRRQGLTVSAALDRVLGRDRRSPGRCRALWRWLWRRGPALSSRAPWRTLSKRAVPCRHKRRWPSPSQCPPSGARAADWFRTPQRRRACPEHQATIEPVEKFRLARAVCEGRRSIPPTGPIANAKERPLPRQRVMNAIAFGVIVALCYSIAL